MYGRWILVAGLMATGLTGSGSLFAQTGKTVLDGVYTAAQAMRGDEVYGARCARCHEGADVDGPGLSGTPFIDRWREDSLEPLFTFIRTKMPQDAEGSLSEGTYLDLLAHLLEASNYRAGTAELTLEAVKNTRLVGPEGPQPLPTNSAVQSIGCLTSAAADNWTLTNAVDVVRTRSGTEIAADELKLATGRPLGKQTIRLQNLDFDAAFKPDALKGHKVLVKGVLVHQSAGDRINLTAVGDAGASCAP